MLKLCFCFPLPTILCSCGQNYQASGPMSQQSTQYLYRFSPHWEGLWTGDRPDPKLYLRLSNSGRVRQETHDQILEFQFHSRGGYLFSTSLEAYGKSPHRGHNVLVKAT